MQLEFTISNKKDLDDDIGVFYDFETDEITYTDGLSSSDGFLRNVSISNELEQILAQIEDIGEILWNSIENDYENDEIVVEFYYNGLIEYFNFNKVFKEWKVILHHYSISEALELTNAEIEEIIELAESLDD